MLSLSIVIRLSLYPPSQKNIVTKKYIVMDMYKRIKELGLPFWGNYPKLPQSLVLVDLQDSKAGWQGLPFWGNYPKKGALQTRPRILYILPTRLWGNYPNKGVFLCGLGVVVCVCVCCGLIFAPTFCTNCTCFFCLFAQLSCSIQKLGKNPTFS